MTTRPIRTAIVGFGTAGRLFHAPYLAANHAFRVDVIVTGNDERARLAREEHADVRVIPDTDALWEVAEDVDLVVVASPSGTHRRIAEAALRVGCHTVVDKPFVADPEEAVALIALAEEKRLMLTVFQNRRWDGDYLTVRDLVRGGRLGEVRRFESRFEWWQPTPDVSWKSTAPVVDAGGILFDLGPHLIDQALQLFGPVSDVYAEIERHRPGAAADDDVFLALDHRSGVRSHLWMSAVAPVQGPRFSVLGSDGGYTSWGLDGQESALLSGARPRDPGFGETPSGRWGTLGTGKRTTSVPTVRGDYGRFYQGVADSILRGSAPPVDPADALEGLHIIARARAAAAQRQLQDYSLRK